MKRSGFTLIELLVVVAIIAILIALLVPAVQKVREAALASQCANNLHQIGVASHSFHSDYGCFPPGTHAKSSASAVVMIMPYLENAAGYNLFDLNQGVQAAANDPKATQQHIEVFLCPADPSGVKTASYGRNNYMANLGSNGRIRNNDGTSGGPFYFDSRVKTSDIFDGTSNTGLFSETKRGNLGSNPELDTVVVTGWTTGTDDVTRPGSCNSPSGSWIKYSGLEFFRGAIVPTAYYTHTMPPNSTSFDCTDSGFASGHHAARSYHNGCVNLCLADGSVHRISNSVSPTIWRALGSRAGGEPAHAPYE